MQNLPTAEVYEKEFAYMPWGILVKEIEEYVANNAPKNATILDLLCGPGYLLGKLKAKRPDLKCLGVDLEGEYIAYAKAQYPDIQFELGDAMTWKSTTPYDVVLCTAGVHHLSDDSQPSFIEKCAQLTDKNGFAIIGDPYISDYRSSEDRKLAGAELGYQYLDATIRNGAPDDVLKATVDIITNDVTLVEYKTSIKKMIPHFEKNFGQVELHKTWPDGESEYGDYYFVLRR